MLLQRRSFTADIYCRTEMKGAHASANLGLLFYVCVKPPGLWAAC